MGLEDELAGFCGSTRFYRHWTGVVFTEGVKYLADEAGAYWLLDVIASYQPKLRGVDFQVWRFEKRRDESALVTMVEDTGKPPLVQEEIPYTDFPLREYKLYYQDNTILLPQEY